MGESRGCSQKGRDFAQDGVELVSHKTKIREAVGSHLVHRHGNVQRYPGLKMTKKRLKKRIHTLEHVIGKLLAAQVTSGQRLDDLEEIVFDVPRATMTEQVDALIPKFNTIGPSGVN